MLNEVQFDLKIVVYFKSFYLIKVYKVHLNLDFCPKQKNKDDKECNLKRTRIEFVDRN